MVKEEPMIRHYVFWGEVKDSFSDWMQWMEDAKEIFALLGESPSHYGISTVEMEDIKERPIGGLSRKLANIQKKGHTIESAGFDLLRDDFWSSLDFYVSISRTRTSEVVHESGGFDFVDCEIDLKYVQEHGGLTPETERQILQLLEQNIVPCDGEVYDRKDKPHGLIYISDHKVGLWLEKPNILMKFDGKEWREI